jgi:hypothetical protein
MELQAWKNVPAVYDGLTARIKKCVAFLGWQTVPEQRRGNEAKRNDLAVAEAEPPTGPVCPAGQKSVNSPVMCSWLALLFFLSFSNPNYI